uniref:NADH dehydrogenase subunit 4L n=1 Tax=Pomphorhynchus tereticollis TaxID=255491 RepID=A0A806GX12_9BILA|nr:NADH dehydrogenase subunit 4L [Pomphorhynchus tereticollis]
MVCGCYLGCKEFKVDGVVGCLWDNMHIVFSKCSFGGGHVPWCEGYFVSGGYGFGIDRGGGLEGLCSGITRVWGQSGVSCFISLVVSAI